MAALIWIVSIAIYGAMGTAVGLGLYLQFDKRGVYEPGPGASLGGVFWPGGIWLMLALAILARIERTKERREVEQRERERLLELGRAELRKEGLI